MANFQLREVDDRLWSQIMVRAQIEGWPLKALILQLLTDYLTGAVKPTRPAPRPKAPRDGPYVTLRFTCPHCNHAMEVKILHVGGFGHMTYAGIPCPNCYAPTERALPGKVQSISKAGDDPGT